MNKEEPEKEPPDKLKSKESETLQETCKEAPPPMDRPAIQESKVKQDQFEEAFREQNDNGNKPKTDEIEPNWSTKNEEKDSESPESPGTPGYMDCQSTPGTPLATQPETLKANFMLGPMKSIPIPSEVGKSISSMIPNVETDEIIMPEGVYEAMIEINREMDRHITEGTYRVIPETFEETQFQIPVGTYETTPGGNIVVEHPPGPSEVEKTAGRGSTAHENLNLSTQSTSCDEFKQPAPMRRRSWLVRSGSQSRSARSSQSSGKEEVTGATAQKRKKKKLSPEAQDTKKAQWDEKYLEKKRITNTPCICGGTLEKHLFLASAENHNLKVQCTGSLESTEIACGFKVISKKDLESIQRAIREKEAHQNQYGSTSEETKMDGKSKKKIKSKECDCGGESPNHKYYVRADDHTVGTRCMGPIRDTEFLVGYDLITIKELEKINLEAEKRHNEEIIDLTQGKEIPGNMETEEIERNPNEGKKEKPEEVISEGSQKMFIDLIQYNLQEEKEKIERENRKKLQKEREKIQKEAQKAEKAKDEQKEPQKPKSSIPDRREAGPSGTTNKKEEIIQAKGTTGGKAIPRREVTNTRKYENKTEREQKSKPEEG
ncbi:hypothetical protein JTB14_038484 [Gonioctena quinquepunctata]|nr:hypothetical protein JTB14_038484 [Gonioctena quinquepunctata]